MGERKKKRKISNRSCRAPKSPGWKKKNQEKDAHLSADEIKQAKKSPIRRKCPPRVGSAWKLDRHLGGKETKNVRLGQKHRRRKCVGCRGKKRRTCLGYCEKNKNREKKKRQGTCGQRAKEIRGLVVGSSEGSASTTPK